jgi:putative membrane protein insertion efficiency factor
VNQAKQECAFGIAPADRPRAARRWRRSPAHLGAWVACLPIHLYRLILSPLLPRACRFYPSCSAYALEALRTQGVLRGSWLALMRLLRCHPFHPGGVDPVPPPRIARTEVSTAARRGRGN